MPHVNMSWTQLVVKRFHNLGERELFSRLSISWHGMPGRKLKNSTFLKHSDLPNTQHSSICWIQKSLIRAKVGIPLWVCPGQPSVGGGWGARSDHGKGQTQDTGHGVTSDLNIEIPTLCPRAPWRGREPRVPPGSPPPIVPAQVVSPDLLPRLAANTEPKQNSLIVKTNFYSLLMHAFSAFTSLTMWQPKEAHQLFCDHPCFHLNSFEHFSQKTYTEKNFHSRQKKPVKPLNKSQHRHYNSNGPFPFYHFSSSQKAHNWFLSTNSLFFRYVTSEL